MSINYYKFNYKFIRSDFRILSNFFYKKIGKYWWFLNSSRLDLAPWGIPNEKLFFKDKIIFITSLFKLIFLIIKKLITKNSEFDLKNKNIFIFEEFKLNIKLKNVEDYYFKDISKKTGIKFINLIIGTDLQNDIKNISIFKLSNKFDVIVILLKSLWIYFKFHLIKNKAILKTKNKFFWNRYQNKNSFLNFYLVNLTYNYFNKCSKNYNSVIFPYEEKPYERAININNTSEENKKKIFAFIINPRDELAIYNENLKFLDIPRTYNYLFPGISVAKKFKKKKRKNSLNLQESIVGSPKFIIKKKIYIKNINF